MQCSIQGHGSSDGREPGPSGVSVLASRLASLINLPDQMATDTEPAPPEPAEDSLASALNRVPAVPGHSSRKPGLIPAAAHIEARAPSPGIASQLALKPGLPVVDLAVRFDDPATGRPAALTVAALWRDPSSARPRRRCLAWTRQR